MGVAVVDHTKLPDDPFEMPPDRSTIICAFGVKGDGKSQFCRRQWRAWPRDGLAIVGEDFKLEPDDGDRLHELPTRFPVDRPALPGEPRRFKKLVYRVDAGSANYDQDLDRAVGVALYPSDNPILLWIDEIGEFPKRVKGNARRAAMQSRHYGPASGLIAGPRPADIDPLWYLQADGIAEYQLPRVDDREKMAQLMGFDTLAEHDEVWVDNRRANGPHSFLFFHAPSGLVLACPAVPYP